MGWRGHAAAKCGEIFSSTTSLAFAQAARDEHERSCRKCTPAHPAPPVGDEAKCLEIAERWAKETIATSMRPLFLGAVRDAYAVGLAAGRKQGAREEREAWAAKVRELAADVPPEELKRAIAARGKAGT